MKELDKLAPALVALQADLVPVTKSASNPFFKSKYAPLNEVMANVQPLLAKHKLAISQFLTNLNGESAMRTILLHDSGQYIEDVQPLLLVKQDPQSQGSATTYARRYGVMSVLGVVADEDDDGNKATQARNAAPKETRNRAEEASQGSEPMGDDTLTRAKRAIFAGLNELGYDAPVQQKAFITKVIGKSIIDSISDAEAVDDAIFNEKGGDSPINRGE